MSEIPGVADYYFEPGAGPVFVGGFHVTDFGTPVTTWKWIVAPTKDAPAANDPGWSGTTVMRNGKTGILVMDTETPLEEGAYDVHIKYSNSDGDTDIIRSVRIFVGAPH